MGIASPALVISPQHTTIDKDFLTMDEPAKHEYNETVRNFAVEVLSASTT
jgi:hypothetical protein